MRAGRRQRREEAKSPTTKLNPYYGASRARSDWNGASTRLSSFLVWDRQPADYAVFLTSVSIPPPRGQQAAPLRVGGGDFASPLSISSLEFKPKLKPKIDRLRPRCQGNIDHR